MLAPSACRFLTERLGRFCAEHLGPDWRRSRCGGFVLGRHSHCVGQPQRRPCRRNCRRPAADRRFDRYRLAVSGKFGLSVHRSLHAVHVFFFHGPDLQRAGRTPVTGNRNKPALALARTRRSVCLAHRPADPYRAGDSRAARVAGKIGDWQRQDLTAARAEDKIERIPQTRNVVRVAGRSQGIPQVPHF